MNSFCHKYTSRIDLNSIWVNELQAEMIKMREVVQVTLVKKQI